MAISWAQNLLVPQQLATRRSRSSATHPTSPRVYSTRMGIWTFQRVFWIRAYNSAPCQPNNSAAVPGLFPMLANQGGTQPSAETSRYCASTAMALPVVLSTPSSVDAAGGQSATIAGPIMRVRPSQVRAGLPSLIRPKEEPKMATHQAIICPGCGETFVAFLQEMADHNEKVVCPKCGKAMDLAVSGARAE